MLEPFTLVMSMNPSRRAEPQTFVDALELLATDNQSWLLRMIGRGEKIPCCVPCTGIKYSPLDKAFHDNGHVLFFCASDLFERGGGDCGSVAALAVAILRCRGKEAWVKSAKGPWGKGSHHAIVGTPAGDYDPTRKMERE